MSTRLRFPAVVALASLFVTVMTASVAMADAVRVKAHIPFEFILGGETFPAGDYVFLVEDPSAPNVLVVQRKGAADVRVSLTAAEADVRPLDKSQIVFDKLDGKYYLSEVWAAGLDQGRVVLDTGIRKEEGRVASAVMVLANK